MNKCFPQSEIPEWFWHQSTGPSLSIQLPSNFSNASTWIGLVLCASFSVHEHPTITSDNLDSEISVASDSPNDKPKNEAGCSYEDPNLGRLRRPIYPEQSSRDSIYLEDQINSAQVIYR